MKLLDDVLAGAVHLGQALQAKGLRCTAAESCTGGAIAAAITSVPGSSAWFDRGFVTYAVQSKTDLLGVPASVIERFGVVSGPVVEAMARGALSRSQADVAVSVSGIAGPGGGTAAQPVGTVWFGWASRRGPCGQECRLFAGDRSEVRLQAVLAALGFLEKAAAG